MIRLLDKPKSVNVGHRIERAYAAYELGQIGKTQYVQMIGYLLQK